ncbi:unnamed protein product [Acanthoscelides obtectus]|uniref:Uncharacterized protein n=1 Tax=Acanthoscelides obtectus TaxID=200917 RepID=A0A9P0L734_ACAOB|nr:unnamed protein product [Acanthoscelides obtectus]CAK1659937.1 hypothetical protein AOBTE_LOCUS21767 [Acanthoscelides obtectus]
MYSRQARVWLLPSNSKTVMNFNDCIVQRCVKKREK